MKRGISPVIAIVVLMLMTVSAAGMAYLTITTYQEEAQTSSEGAVEQLAGVGQSQVKVESISEGKLYLRSIGDNCEGLIVQVGNEPAQVLGDCESSMDVFNINSSCEGGYQTVKVTVGGQTITQRVECSELIGAQAGGLGVCDNVEAVYRQDARVFGSYSGFDEFIYAGHNYTAPSGRVLRRVDLFMPYGNSSSEGNGTVNVFVTDDSIYSTDPSTLTPNASVWVDSSDVNKWVSLDLNVPVSGEFMVVFNLENATSEDMPFGYNQTFENSTLVCIQGNPSINCTDGMDKYESFAGYGMAFNMIAHVSTSDEYGSLCDSGLFCNPDSCSLFLTNVGGCVTDEDCSEGVCCGGVCCAVGESCCDSMCVDTQTNETYCGDCMTSCTGTQYCNSGSCSECGVCDGTCLHEDCQGIDGDCGIPGGEVECCGNGYCNSTAGETCETCESDCGVCHYYLTTFSDDSSEENLIFSAAGTNSSAKLEINASASIVSASVKVRGIFYNKTIDGRNENDELGSSLSTGDINNDGHMDLLVGEEGYGSYKGRAYVFWGSSSGISADNNFTITGEGSGDQFGSSVSSGDLNNDTYDEFLVGARYYGSNSEGRAYVFWGNETSDFTASNNYTVNGEDVDNHFGSSVSSGDLNNDGYDDFLVGARHWTGNAYVFWGSSSGISESDNVTITGGNSGDRFGSSVSSGDLNGDGYDEFLVGATGYLASYGQGRVYVFWGNETGDFSNSNNYAIDGENDEDEFGISVSTGDLNNDGYADLLVGAHHYGSDKGRAYVFWGNETDDFSSSNSYNVTGENDTDVFGRSVFGGDLNNDGYDDFLVGALDYGAGRGKTYVFWGSSSGVSAEGGYGFVEGSDYDYFGSAVGAEDFDNDGYDELIISAEGWPTQYFKGRVYIYNSKDSVISPSLNPGSDVGTAWSYTGRFFDVEIADTASEVNSILPDCSCSGCSLSSGNCTIDLNVSSGSAGKVRLLDLFVNYTLS